MMKKLFDVEGPVFGFLDKFGQLILLSLCWLIGCLPVVTIVGANAALYYGVCKSIRFGQGSPVREFWRSYRQNFFRGMGVTVLLLGTGALLVLGFVRISAAPGGFFAVGMILIGCMLCYAGPVLSRFRFGVGKAIKLSLVVSLQFAHYTLLFLVGTGLLLVGTVYVLPMAFALILPGVWCLLVTYPMEKVLRTYMPAKADKNNNWYYGN